MPKARGEVTVYSVSMSAQRAARPSRMPAVASTPAHEAAPLWGPADAMRSVLSTVRGVAMAAAQSMAVRRRLC